MQDITPTLKQGKKLIGSYGNGGFKISGERFEGNVIILPDSVHGFNSQNIEDCTEADIAPVTDSADEIEILLVGGGSVTKFFSPQIEKLLRSRSISIEYMDTGAAARTYNILLSEERKVAVVLIAV